MTRVVVYFVIVSLHCHDLLNSLTYCIIIVISYFNMYYRTVVVYLSLWDEAAAMFRGLISSGDRTQTVMVVRTVNPKKFASLYICRKYCFAGFVDS